MIGEALLTFVLAATTAGPPPGEYLSGDGLGVNWSFSVTPRGRFRFSWHGCLGLYDSNQGPFTVDGSWLTLAPERPRANGFRRQLPLRWLYLKWGERHYLIADDELTEFVRSVNSASEPRAWVHGLFLLRKEDWNLPAPGAPPLPAEWVALLRPNPVSAKVVAVDEKTATLDLGTDAGLAVGLPLTVTSPPGDKDSRLAWGTVTEVTQSSARLRITTGIGAKPGDIASTKPH